jgi:hypothetical protein
MTTASQVDVLVRHVQRTCPDAVDALQVAAVLESDGLTDRVVRDDHGHRDVFALAEVVFARLPTSSSREPSRHRRRDRRDNVRVWSHGVLYALPSAVFPAAHALLGLRGLIAGLVFATALGWVWSMGNSVLAYRLLGWGHATTAARVLRGGMLLGLAVGAVGAAVLSWWYELPVGVVALVICQLGFQLAASILVFLRRERTLLLVTAPAVVLGLGQIMLSEAVLANLLGNAVLPNPWAPRPAWVAALAVVCVGVAVTTAYLATREPDTRIRELAVAVPPVNPPPPRLRRELLAVLPIVGYAGLCAGYLLFADSRYLDSGLDAALAVTPLVLGMGAVEWQARRFGEAAVALTHRCRYPAEFASGVWRLFGRGLASVVGILVMLTAAMLAVLGYAGHLTGRGVVLTTAHLFLAASFFVGFVLIHHGRLPVLVTVMGVALVGQVLPTVAGLPHQHGVVFLLTSAALLTALLGAVATSLTQVRRYRW